MVKVGDTVRITNPASGYYNKSFAVVMKDPNGVALLEIEKGYYPVPFWNGEYEVVSDFTLTLSRKERQDLAACVSDRIVFLATEQDETKREEAKRLFAISDRLENG